PPSLHTLSLPDALPIFAVHVLSFASGINGTGVCTGVASHEGRPVRRIDVAIAIGISTLTCQDGSIKWGRFSGDARIGQTITEELDRKSTRLNSSHQIIS